MARRLTRTGIILRRRGIGSSALVLACLVKRLALIVLVLAGSVGCDQATKRVAIATLEGRPTQRFFSDTVRLGFARNEGAFLSLGANLPSDVRFWLLTVTVGVVLFGLLGFLVRSRELTSIEAAGYAMILGGGLSNWIDRARHDGSVVDFLNVGLGSLRTGIFNVADLAIFAGIAVVLCASRSVPAGDQRAA